ncbi:hypothetical protein DVK44_18200 [Streptomyces paludis]|uniref:FAD-binding domain-containing protein n=1 Tax=Streptomyces paludis TaxID=2282738 RepID=A0A345HRE7_9ACTN|nr:hypothetical protein DVK44_18200 [Streptomyces paludis]
MWTIHLPRWSTGLVAFVGDAAHAPSFLSGQGSSLALVGAYVPSHAGRAGRSARTGLAAHSAAFAAYEGRIREFVRQNQALATSGGTALLPRIAEELALRNNAR